MCADVEFEVLLSSEALQAVGADPTLAGALCAFVRLGFIA